MQRRGRMPSFASRPFPFDALSDLGCHRRRARLACIFDGAEPDAVRLADAAAVDGAGAAADRAVGVGAGDVVLACARAPRRDAGRRRPRAGARRAARRATKRRAVAARRRLRLLHFARNGTVADATALRRSGRDRLGARRRPGERARRCQSPAGARRAARVVRYADVARTAHRRGRGRPASRPHRLVSAAACRRRADLSARRARRARARGNAARARIVMGRCRRATGPRRTVCRRPFAGRKRRGLEKRRR